MSGFFAVSDKAVLMLVFIVSMEHTDLLHFVYILFFVVFVTSNKMAKKYWGLLVVYNGVVILTRYIVELFSIGMNSTLANDIGLAPSVRHEYVGIYYPSLLMIFLLIQYNFVRYHLETLNVSKFLFGEYILKNTSTRQKSLGFAVVYVLYFMPMDGWLLISYFVFLCVGLSDLHVINLGYIVLVLLALLCHQYSDHVWGKVRVLWLLVMSYCVLAFVLLYAVQYPFVEHYLQNTLYPTSWEKKYLSLEDIGLIRKKQDDLFAIINPMIGPVLALIISFLQFGMFFKLNRLEQKATYI
ncbi:hypothetical protein RFI_18885 [Reticulomyxa filosa]|uniref:Piezo TM1-24 domain-containing protein n=1 Tax=Reticulomyxa filosa TaxID=46433 RepID=X6MZB4_RETFI|nr:hypothetical protein RFI_18885 [Reticulomyxa filosa]|eukprot:ETO18380.1 hypothetical protein RFI_18885 [Reticulomyxa filosa]